MTCTTFDSNAPAAPLLEEYFWDPESLKELSKFRDFNTFYKIMKLYPKLESDKFLKYYASVMWEQSVEEVLSKQPRESLVFQSIYNSTKLHYKDFLDSYEMCLLAYRKKGDMNLLPDNKKDNKDFMEYYCEFMTSEGDYIQANEYAQEHNFMDRIMRRRHNKCDLRSEMTRLMQSDGLSELEALKQVIKSRDLAEIKKNAISYLQRECMPKKSIDQRRKDAQAALDKARKLRELKWAQ